MLLDYCRIAGRAAFIRNKCGFFEESPPYSMRRIMEVVFPKIHVTGGDLPSGVIEMVERKGNRRTIFYNRKYGHDYQRLGIAHALHHLICDMKRGSGIAECNLNAAELERSGHLPTDPIEIACDLFAGELLVPFDVLDEYAPASLVARGADGRQALDDELDHLASRFNLPRHFIVWRLQDLAHLRKTHFAVATK